jgi:hypothetical protein
MGEPNWGDQLDLVPSMLIRELIPDGMKDGDDAKRIKLADHG